MVGCFLISRINSALLYEKWGELKCNLIGNLIPLNNLESTVFLLLLCDGNQRESLKSLIDIYLNELNITCDHLLNCNLKSLTLQETYCLVRYKCTYNVLLLGKLRVTYNFTWSTYFRRVFDSWTGKHQHKTFSRFQYHFNGFKNSTIKRIHCSIRYWCFCRLLPV